MTEKPQKNPNSEQISEDGIILGTLTEQIENLIGNYRENIQEKEPRHNPVQSGKNAADPAETRQVLGRPVCDRRAIPRTLVQSKVVRSRLIILINEEINKANWMVNNSAKLDRRTKQHTQFGVSASNGSGDMARTKSWQKKKNK